VTSGTNYSWSCTGANGGVPASCYANKIVQVLVTPPTTIAQQNRSYGAAVDAGQTDDPLVDGVSYSGEVHYIDCLGDDTKDGKTPLTAWRTTSQVNTKTNVGYWDTAAPNGNTNPKNHTPWVAAPSGSAFLFKRGCVFDGFINVHASNFTKTPVVSIENITFGAYGERSLARPKFRYSTLSNLYRGSLWNNGHIVHIKNLHFDGGGTSSSTGISLYKSSGSTVENSVIENIQNDGINADFSDNILVKNTTILNTNLNQGRGGGFTGSGNNLKILNSTFIDNGRDQIGAHDIYVRHLTNSVIDGNLLKGGSNLGIVIHGSSTNVSITNNDIYGNSNGIDVTGGYAESETFDGILIANNKIHDNGYRTGEQGYGLLLRSMINSSIVNNIIYGNRLGGMVFQDGTAGDAMSKNVYIYNNTFSGKDAFHLGGGNLSLVSIKNNIFNTTDNTAAFTKRAEVPYSAFVSNNNLYFSNINSTTTVLSDGVKKYSVVSFASTTGQEKFSFYGDPLFLDSATYDFRLQTSSPAKNQGVAPKIIKDFDGVLRNATTPSLGAFE
jgi:hypothetical protein